MPKLSVILIAGAAFNGCERAVFDSSVSVAGSGVDLPELYSLKLGCNSFVFRNSTEASTLIMRSEQGKRE